MKIEKVKLAPQGPSFSQIIAGTMRWGEWGVDLSVGEMAELIAYCIEQGITSFDHADIYGNYSTEASFGEALSQLDKDVRSQIQLITKTGIRVKTHRRPENIIQSYDTSAAYIQENVNRSLENLRTDYLDLLLIHRPDPLMDPDEVAETFENLHAAGKVKYFGVSNFTPHQFELLASKTNLLTNQVQCNPLHADPIFDGTFDQLKMRNLKPMIWSPLGGKDYFRKESTAILRLRDTVRRLSIKYGDVGEDVVLLAWLLKLPVGAIPIVGTTQKSRLRETRLALEVDMSRQEWFEILRAARGYEVP